MRDSPQEESDMTQHRIVTREEWLAARLESCRRRMGWSFEWVSARGNDFSADFGVSLPPDQDPELVRYNFNSPWRQPGQKHIPKGRNEDGLSGPLAWIRRRDQYEKPGK